MEGTLCCPQARDGVRVWLTGAADAAVKVKGLCLPGTAPSPGVSGPCARVCVCCGASGSPSGHWGSGQRGV